MIKKMPLEVRFTFCYKVNVSSTSQDVVEDGLYLAKNMLDADYDIDYDKVINKYNGYVKKDPDNPHWFSVTVEDDMEKVGLDE